MKFTKSEKIILLQEIKNHPVIWNKKSKGYYNVQRVEKAWKEISKVLTKSELECKKCFHSLRSCQRYQRNKKQQLQKRLKEIERNKQGIKDSGAASGLNEWEMEKYLNFLPERTYKSMQSPSSSIPIDENSSQNVMPVQIFKINKPTTANHTVEAINVANNDGSVYSYVTTSQPINDLNEDSAAASSFLNDVWNTSSVDDKFQMQEVLKYDGMLRNIDWLLQKLAETDVIDLNMQFIQLIYDKLKRNDDIIESGVIEPETIC